MMSLMMSLIHDVNYYIFKDEDEYTVTHAPDQPGFMLFTYKVKKFSSKKKVRIPM